MNFLLPAAWGLTALALPILLLYLIRQRSPRRPVSSLLFWDQLQPQVHHRPFWRRFRQWFSFLLQIVFLLLLTAALSRPLWKWLRAEAQTRIIVLDTSVSMLARGPEGTAWDQALEAANETISRMRYGDKTAIVLTGQPPETAQEFNTSRRALRNTLSGIQPSHRDTPITPALELAQSLAEAGPNSTILLITDRIWPEEPPPDLLAGARIITAKPPQRNIGITRFAARRSPGSPGEFIVTARIGYSGPDAFEGELLFYRNERLTDARPLEIQPGGSWEKTWLERSESALDLTLEIGGPATDALSQDNRASAKLAPLQALTVHLVSEPNPFLEAVFQSMPRVVFRRIAPARLASELEGLPEADCWVFHQSRPPEDFKSGATIMLEPAGAGFWGEPAGMAESPLVSEWKQDDPLLRHTGIDKVTLQRATVYDPAGRADIYASSFGTPLIFGRWDGASKWMVFAFGIERSDFALRTAFPIMMSNLVQSLRGGQSLVSADLPGKTETALRALGIPPGVPVRTEAEAAPLFNNLWRAPLWWWLISLGLMWCLCEWWLFTRRITE